MKKLIDKASLFLSLFTSSTTLLCCALPALFVFLGMGSVFASLTSMVPGIIWISEKKIYLFFLTGFFLMFSAYFEYRNKNILCLPDLSQECKPVRNWSKIRKFL